MSKIIDEFCVKNYRVLILNEPLPLRPFHKVVIDGKERDITIVYDLKNSFAVQDEGNALVGKEVDFV